MLRTARATRRPSHRRATPVATAVLCALASAALLACTSPAVPFVPADTDGAIPNPPPVDCTALSTSVGQWFTDNAACTSDADCMLFVTTCGLPGACGGPANLRGDDTTLRTLTSEWVASCTDGIALVCHCPAVDTFPPCVNGSCGTVSTPTPITGPGAIGDPCQSGADCASGDCFTSAEGFPGGYCTIRDCDLRDFVGCPHGSTCAEDRIDHSDCVADCAFTTGGTASGVCRGPYVCCSPEDSASHGECVRTTSPLCGG